MTGGRDPCLLAGVLSAFLVAMSGDLAGSQLGTAMVMDDCGLSCGCRPDYGSGPYLRLCVAAVRLARRDLCDADLAAEAREFLDGSELVEVFADCVQFGGKFT